MLDHISLQLMLHAPPSCDFQGVFCLLLQSVYTHHLLTESLEFTQERSRTSDQTRPYTIYCCILYAVLDDLHHTFILCTLLCTLPRVPYFSTPLCRLCCTLYARYHRGFNVCTLPRALFGLNHVLSVIID